MKQMLIDLLTTLRRLNFAAAHLSCLLKERILSPEKTTVIRNRYRQLNRAQREVMLKAIACGEYLAEAHPEELQEPFAVPDGDEMPLFSHIHYLYKVLEVSDEGASSFLDHVHRAR